MKVANIISNIDLIISDFFNVVKTIDEINPSLPTLIIGFDYTDKLFPGFDITEMKIKDNVYWTFKKSEKRDKFQEDLNWFMNKVYCDLIKDVHYIFVDLLLFSPRKLIKIIRKIYSLKNIVSYSIGTMIYIYDEKLIFGVDLTLAKYLGLNIDKIKNKIKLKSSVFLDKDSIPKDIENIFEVLDNKIRFTPYFYSILNV